MRESLFKRSLKWKSLWIFWSRLLMNHFNCGQASVTNLCAFFMWKKLNSFFLQASEDAKRLVNQERSFACAEIESARAVVQRIGEALDEEERNSPTSAKQVTTMHWFILIFDMYPFIFHFQAVTLSLWSLIYFSLCAFDLLIVWLRCTKFVFHNFPHRIFPIQGLYFIAAGLS